MVAVIPSGGRRARRRRVRLLALVAVRDEARYLPGWLENVAAHVDGVVALDDGSGDGSADLLAGAPEVVELIRRPPERPTWDEMANHRELVAAALRHGGEWALCLDADERLERDFRERAERVIARGRALGLSAYALRLRELWDREDRFRADGIWGAKAVGRLFRMSPSHVFDERPLHALKTPVGARRPFGCLPIADLNLYHLRMVDPADRVARRRRYERLDPESRWQRQGYAYLTDDRGLRLEPVPAHRSWRPTL